jgi:hypothetical protein
MINGETIRADADAIYRERVLRARNTPPDQKMIDGIRLFERACDLMRDGIRYQFPNADPRQVEEILRQRLDIVQRLQEGDLYRPCLDDDA